MKIIFKLYFKLCRFDICCVKCYISYGNLGLFCFFWVKNYIFEIIRYLYLYLKDNMVFKDILRDDDC